MGYFLLMVLISCEMIVTIRTFQTKEIQQKTKQIIHLSQFILFLFLCIIRIFDWGFRYYLLAFVLLIESVSAVYHLKTNRYRNKTFHPVKHVLKEIAVIFSMILLVLPSIIFLQYKEPKMSGNYKVATATYTFTDKNRSDPYENDGSKRFVTAEFWYPKDMKEQVPFILFSHGTYGIRNSNESTYRDLASNGYVVCSLDHPHHSFFTKSTNGIITLVDTSVIQLINDINLGVYDERTKIQLLRDLTMIRVDDMNFVINKVLAAAESDRSDELFHIIDSSKIGVFGHSLGGAAAIELGRRRSDILAVANIDGDMRCEYLDYIDNSYVINQTPYPRPLLNIWCTNSIELMENDLPINTLPEEYIAKTTPVVFNITFQGTNHFSFTDLSITSPGLCKLFLRMAGVSSTTSTSARSTLENMNQTILDFFDCYLKGNGEFTPSNEYVFPTIP